MMKEDKLNFVKFEPKSNNLKTLVDDVLTALCSLAPSVEILHNNIA